jgi:KRAB domain-containing zinc finger protein
MELTSRVKVPCKLCKEDILLSRMTAHIKESHILTGQKDCEMCDYVAPSVFRLREHINTHFNLKPYSCCHCSSTYATKNSLRLHEFSHTGYPYPCTISDCKSGFPVPSALQAHLDMHARRDKCSVCSVQCSSPAHLKLHMKKRH